VDPGDLRGVVAKYGAELKRSMLPAIDIAHPGALTSDGCVRAYLDPCGDSARRVVAAM
jgi:hypothetical protein